MPFMIGPTPIRRTLKFLEAGRLVLKDQIKIFSINYNIGYEHETKCHHGAKDFVFWYLPQVQYKNPNVQVIAFRNMTPTPFIRCFYEDGKQMLIDVNGKNKDEIYDHLVRVVGKTGEVLRAEAVAKEKKDNPANFGYGCDRPCVCVLPGQIPCPATCPLPKHMRGKYKYQNKED